MKKVALFLLATLLLSCQPDRTPGDQEDENEALTIQLVCEDIGSDDAQPYFGVYAKIGRAHV